jgi:hypothetical protein
MLAARLVDALVGGPLAETGGGEGPGNGYCSYMVADRTGYKRGGSAGEAETYSTLALLGVHG